jgi:hypothetical protein
LSGVVFVLFWQWRGGGQKTSATFFTSATYFRL